MPPVLDVATLAKTVPGGRRLFDRLSFALEAGEIVAVRGESGAGKSTLLNLVAGLDDADGGTVRLCGEDVGALSEAGRAALRRARIGFVFQAFHVLPHLTLAQNVGLPLLLLGRAPDARAAATDMLARVGLGGRDGDYPGVLSGGELQRVAIARSIVHRPALILADEPTGNLDPDTAERVMALLVAQVRDAGAAMLIVTHSDRAAAVADRVLWLEAEAA